jgi:NAD(P)-dependent dehydrogenase (short-subunit alcohol dehydrogenase family)
LSNTFGIALLCPFDELTLDEYMKTIWVNQVGVFLGMKAVCPSMIAQRSGAIVNFSSNAALLSQPFLTAYSASKAAVNAMTRSVAADVGPYGLRVNTESPGSVRRALKTATQNGIQQTRESLDGQGSCSPTRVPTAPAAPSSLTGDPRQAVGPDAEEHLSWYRA